jgi:Type II secretory pathway, pullulanase PulA and related glycosidases
LGREDYGFDQGGGFLDSCRQDPVLSQVKLIAEPWDCGPGGYQVGGFPPGWSEWNDKFRDTVRDFWRGEAPASELAPRITASATEFAHQGRRPWASINFVTAHDGFTLNDMVTYNEKHNEANNENNQDGSSDNRSWNCGVEGPTDDPAINELRERQIRNVLTTLLLSQGVPMLLAGDEFARTQQGNNNAYCQDSEISWLDWNIGDKGQGLIRFVRTLTKLRLDHPALRNTRFLTGREVDGVRDVTWMNANGTVIEDAQWGDTNMKCFGMMIDGRAATAESAFRQDDSTFLLVFNAHYDAVEFTLPECKDGEVWTRVIDTNDPEPETTVALEIGAVFTVTGRSVVVFSGG